MSMTMGLENHRQTMIESPLGLDDIGDDVLIEILCRVSSYRDLMRCKCVSKRWLFLISNPDPSFVARRRFLCLKKLRSWTYIYRSWTDNGCGFSQQLYLTSNDSVFRSLGFSLSFLPCYRPEKPDSIDVLHAFNDLLLCCEAKLYHRVYYVCNPLTKQWVVLPETRYHFFDHKWIFVNLICESCGEDHELGGSMCRFKVVRVYSDAFSRRPVMLTIEIFSSETRQWVKREVLSLPDKPFPKSKSWGGVVTCDWNMFEVAHDGHVRVYPRKTFPDPQLWWRIDTCNGNLFVTADDGHVMVFNLNSFIHNNGSTNYGLLRLPKVQSSKLLSPMACQGRLRAVHLVFDTVRPAFDPDYSNPILSIWELKLKEDYNVKADADDDEYWSLVHRVSLANIMTNTNECFWDVFKKWYLPGLEIRVLGFQPEDGNILYLIFNGNMTSYDIWNKTLTLHPCRTPRYQNDFLQFVLPLRPTKLPKL